MSDNLMPKIKDGDWFLELIERRLEENKRCEDDSHRQMNELALMSAIDFRLKYLNSMKSPVKKNMIERIMDVCKQNGFVPQYESSGAPAFMGDEIKLSPDGKFIASFGFGSSVTLLPAKEFFVWTKLFHHEKEKNIRVSDISFSPDSSKIAILYRNDQLRNDKLRIWDVAELKLLISSDDMDEYATEKTLSWSTDSKRIAYRKKEKEICVYDFIDKKTITLNRSAPSVCLNDCGTEILLLNGLYEGRKGTIVVLDVESGEELFNEKAEVSLWNSEPLFKDGQFYVLTAGVILKIGEGKVEIIEPDDVISPLSFKDWKPDHRCFKLEVENENIIAYTKVGHEKLNYIISDTLDVKQIRIDQKLYEDKDRLAKEKKIEIDEIISNLTKKHICLDHKKSENTQTVYITNQNSLIGFELVDENDLYEKWNYREYIFEDQPTFNRHQIVPPEFMESYEKISTGDSNEEFQKEKHLEFYLPNHKNRQIYFRKTGNPVTIKDSSQIKFIDFRHLEYMKEHLQKKIHGDEIAYILEAKNISNQIYHLPADQEKKEMLILNKDRNDIDVIPLPSGTRIETDDLSKEYYLDEENNLYCIDPFSKIVVKIAENEPIAGCPLNEISYITGSDWPKIYVTGEKGNHWIEKPAKKIFIQSAPMQKIVQMKGISLSWVHNIHIFSGKIYWMNNDRIFVSNLDGSDIKQKKLIYLDEWQSLGTNQDGKISLIKIEENKKDQKRMTIRFARLYPENGHVDVFEKAALDKYTYQDLNHFVKIDVKDTAVIIRSWLNKIESMRITKEGMKSIKVSTPSIDKLEVIMTPVDDEKYIISTTEYEKTNEENEQKSEEEVQEIISDSNFNWRPQLRVMNSKTGSKLKYNVNQSEGQLYGLPGYAIEKSSKVFSLDEGKFIVLDMKNSTSFTEHTSVVLSWDISTGARYPPDSKIIPGKLLGTVKGNEICVAKMDSGYQVLSVVTYNKKMKMLSEEKPIFDWGIDNRGSNYGMINFENLKQNLQQFPDLPKLPKMAADIPYYTNVITGIDPLHKIEEGDVLLFPIRVCGEKRIESVFPRISPVRDVKKHNPLIWINIEAIIGTLSYGRIINPKKVILELVTCDGEDEKSILRNCLWSVSAYNVNGTYIIQQPVQEKPDDVYEQMKYRTRIISPDDREIIVEGVNGWQPGADFDNIPDDQIEKILDSRRMQTLRDRKMISLYAGPESFSYIVLDGEDMCFVTHTSQEKKVKKICSKHEGQPVALYSDENVSISFIPPRRLLFTFENETKIIENNSSKLWEEALNVLYNGGQFELISKEKDGALRFSIGGKEMRLKGTEIEILEKRNSVVSDSDKSICELSDGIIQNYEGIFVKKYT